MKINPQEIFEEARDYIKGNYGLNLTLIELVRLKKDYVLPCIEKLKRTSDNCDQRFDPDIEAATTFLTDYYGVPAQDENFTQSFMSNFSKRGEMGEYCKRIQERAHMP